MADPDFQIRGGGGGTGHEKNFFRPCGPQFGLKIRGDPGSPGSSPRSTTAINCYRDIHRISFSLVRQKEKRNF